MGDEQGAEAQGQPLRQDHHALYAVEPPGEAAPEGEEGHEEQAHGHAGHNVGVHHGDAVHCAQRRPGAPPEAVKADGGEGPGHRGDGRRQQGDQQGRVDAAHDEAVLEEGLVPVQGEARPDDVAVAFIKGEDDQQQDGRVEKQEDQGRQDPASGTAPALHRITACSSPSPKRFMTTMQTTTMTIITREMAAPSWGL